MHPLRHRFDGGMFNKYLSSIERYIRVAMDWIAGFSSITKWTFVVLVKSLAVSIVLGILAPYATALYAIKNGFRVPVEGVPYINLAISLFSFVGFFIAVSSFTVLMTVLKQIGALDKIYLWIFKPTPVDVYLRTRILGSRISLAFSFILFPLSIYAASFFAVPECTSSFSVCFIWSRVLILSLSFAISLAFICFYLVAHEYKPIHVQVALSFPLVIFMSFLLFLPDVYGSFLRVIRYGGGIQAEITTKSSDFSSSQKFNGYIMMQNDDMMILLTEDRTKVLELQKSDILLKTIPVSPIWKKPDYSLIRQRELVDLF